jgi:hypothetical protein
MEAATLKKKFKFVPVILLVLALMAVTVIPQVYGSQPHMQNALASLRTARAELEKAVHDKGGHRVRAIKLVDQAIQQVELGIARAE